MYFEDLYFNLELVFRKGSVSIPFMPNFSLDNIVEGYFMLALSSKPKQNIAKEMIRAYLTDQKAQGKSIKMVVLLPDAEGKYDSPAAVKTDRMFYDSFPENIDRTIIYCIERNVFESIYGKELTKSIEAAVC